MRQLEGSLTWQLMQACHARGQGLILASAAAIAVGSLAIPVYEIYKVGEDVHWKPGLDLLAHLGLRLVVVPHWNNSDGGEELDTRRCFLGEERFRQLAARLEPDLAVLGIDENTAVVFDFEREIVEVFGRGSVHLLRDGIETTFSKGEQFALQQIGNYTLKLPDLPARIWQMAAGAGKQKAEESQTPVDVPEQVLDLVARRRAAREAAEWSEADVLRGQILSLGWSVKDTPQGPQVVKADPGV